MFFRAFSLTQSRLRFSLFLVCILSSLWFLFESSQLPDYQSYLTIFEEPDRHFSWNPAFVYLVKYSSLFFTYEEFRVITFALGLSMLVCACRIKINANIFAVIFFIFLILFEFFMVRIRAGICIALFYSALLVFLRSQRIFALILWCLSLLLHPATAVVLSLVYVPSRLFGSRSIKSKLILQTFSWIVFFLIIDYKAAERGPNLVSDISFIRVFLLALFPLFLLAALEGFKVRLERLDSVEIISSITSSIALVLLWSVGTFETSGEAVTRVFSLIVGPSLLIGYLWKFDSWASNVRFYAQTVLVFSCILFLNAVFLRL